MVCYFNAVVYYSHCVNKCNVFLDIVQHNSFSICSADQEHLFCFFDVDEDAPEFCFLFAVFDNLLSKLHHSQRSRPKSKLRSMHASASLFVNCLSFLFSGVV